MNINKVFNILIELNSTDNDNKNYNVISATLDNRNNIISIAKNSYVKTHPMQHKFAIKLGCINKDYLHAEIAALVKSHIQAKSIIVIRISKSGLIKIAKPCRMCMLAIKEAKIKKIYYTDSYGNLICEKVNYNN